MERHLRRSSRILVLLGLCLTWAPAPAWSQALLPEDFTVEGRLFDTSGTAINASVDFLLEVVDDAGSCVLYREERLGVDLSSTDTTAQGVFSLRLGGGNKLYAPLSFTQMFSTGPITGEGSCTPVAMDATHHRKVRVSTRLNATGSYETLSPNTNITSAPLAKVAESALTLQGLGTSSFLAVNGTSALSQANAEYAFSLTNWPRLKALVDGTSGAYLTQNSTTAYDMNGQRVTDVADPSAAQDAATKHYADGKLGGSTLDVSAVGPMTGGGSTLLWDATANKWVAGTVSSAPTGAAGGDLTGTYPNPTIANDKITSAKINSTGIAVNRLLITDATTGANLAYGGCTANGQVYAWTATGWQCATVASLAPVVSVAGKTGVVTLNANDISGLGTAALFDWGTGANQIVRLDSGAKLPALDGSQLLNVNSTLLASRAVASTAPNPGQVLGWNSTFNMWQPVNVAAGGVTQIATGAGLLGGPISTIGTLSVNVGTAATQIVQENANAQIAQGNGSAAQPSYAFGNALGTGMYSSGVNQLSLSSNGTAALTILPGGTVGIGTMTPSALLHVNGNGFFSGTLSTSNNLIAAGTVAGGTAASVNLTLDSTLNPTKGSILMASAGGNVGVGTASPQAVLDVWGLGTSSALLIPRDVTGNRPGGVNGMLRYNTTANAFEGFANGAWSTIAAGTAAGTVQNIAAGTGLLGGPITTTGTLSVNVGTASTQIVQENGNAQIAQSNGSASLPSYAFGASPNTGVYSPGANQLALSTNGNAALTILASGKVGIGTMTPAATLQVSGGDVLVDSTRVIRFEGSASSAWRLGVGSNPYTKSLVTGNSIDLSTSGNDYEGFSIGNGGGTGQSYYEVAAYPGFNLRHFFRGIIGIGTTAPAAGLDVATVGTAGSAIVVPRDTTTNRPTGVNGMIRYNTSNNNLEGFVNGSWSAIAAGASAGTVTSIATGTGLVGGPIISTGTLTVNVGTTGNQIPQLNANAQLALARGSTTQPTYAFAGDTTTGLYSPGTGSLSLAIGGTTAFTIKPSGTISTGAANAADAGLIIDSYGLNNATLANALRFGSGVNQVGIASNQQVGDYQNGLDFYTAGAKRLSISSTGLIGIGTNAPRGILDLNVTGSSASALVLPRDTSAGRPAPTNGMIRYNTTNNLLETVVNSAWVNVATGSNFVSGIAAGTGLLGGPITSSGTLSVNVGTASGQVVAENGSGQILQANGVPATPAYSFGGSQQSGLYSPGTNQVAIATAGVNRLTVDNNGLVGIGSASPGYALDVAGDVRTSGAVRFPYTYLSSSYGSSINYLNLQPTGTGAGTIFSISPPTGSTWSSLTLFNNTTSDINNYGTVSVQGPNMTVGTMGAINLSLMTNGQPRLGISSSGGVGIGTTAAANGLNINMPVVQKTDTQNSTTLDMSVANIVTSSTACSSTTTLNNMVSGGSYTVITTDSGTSACNFGSNTGTQFKYLPPMDARVSGSTSIYNILVVQGIAYVTWVSGF